MSLRRVNRRWEKLARTDPLWAILSDPSKKGNRWEVDRFFRTGQDEIRDVLDRVGALGYQPGRGTERLGLRYRERLQAAYVSRLYLIAMRLGVERAHIMFVSDSDTFNGGFFNNDDRSWWEQTYAVNNMINLMPNPRLIGAIHDGGYGENDLPDSYGYYAYTFDPDTTVTGEPSVIVAWNVEGPITVSIPCDPGDYIVYSMLGDSGIVSASDSSLSVEIGPCPIYITKE